MVATCTIKALSVEPMLGIGRVLGFLRSAGPPTHKLWCDGATQAELMELRAPQEGSASATVVEAQTGRAGVQATVIVRQGRLKVGDPVVVGTEWGRVRALRTGGGSGAGEAAPAGGVGPGQHALVVGLKGLPQAGDVLTVGGWAAHTLCRVWSAEYSGFRVLGRCANDDWPNSTTGFHGVGVLGM